MTCSMELNPFKPLFQAGQKQKKAAAAKALKPPLPKTPPTFRNRVVDKKGLKQLVAWALVIMDNPHTQNDFL